MRYVQFFKTQLQNFVNGVPDEEVEKTIIPLHAPLKKGDPQPAYATDEIFDDLRTPMSAERYTQEDLRDFLNLYSTHTWTYRCVNTIATAAATVDFVFKRKKEDIDEDSLIGFLKQPNFFQTWYDLIETTFQHLELAGNSFWEVQRDPKNKNKIINIFPLRPDRIEIVPHPKKRVLQYIYRVNGTIITYEPDEILHFKYADAKGEFFGVSPASASRNTVTLDFYAVAWNKEFFARGAEPGAVLETENTLTEMAWNRLMKIWNKRHRGKPHEIALLEEGLKYRQITSSHADMQYLEGRDKNAEEIGAVYNVPPFYLGRDGGGPPSEQKKRFYQTNVIPKIIKFEKFLNTFLFASQGVKIDFLTKSLPMIIEDEEIKARIAQSNVNHGIWTQNEARKIEWDMKSVPWGDTWWQSVGLFDVQKPETRPVQGGIAGDMPGNSGSGAGKTSAFNHPSQVPAPTQKGSRAADEGQEIEKDLWGMVPIAKMEINEPNWADKESVADWQEYVFWKQSAGQDELAMRAQFKTFFKEQGDRIVPRVGHLWPLHKAEQVPADARQIAIAEILKLLFDDQTEEGVLRAVIAPLVKQSVTKHGNTLLQQYNIPIPFRATNPNVRKFMDQFTASQVRNITETTRAILKNQLIKAAEAGEPIKAVLARVRDVFDGNISVARAQKIARTELVTMSNGGRFMAAQQSGVLPIKRWVSEKLPTTRQEKVGANHISMHGVEKGINEPFEAPNRRGGMDLMDFPGADSGSAENVCNCVCVVRYKRTGAFDDLIENGGEPEDVPVEKIQRQRTAQAIEAVASQLADAMVTIAELKRAAAEPRTNINVTTPPVTINTNVAQPPAAPAPQVTNNIVVQPADVKAPDVNIVNKVDPTPVTIQNTVEQPDITVQNEVNPTPVNVAAPSVTVQNTVEQPNIKIENNVETVAPVVNIKPVIHADVSMPVRQSKTHVKRDSQGRIVETETTEEDVK